MTPFRKTPSPEKVPTTADVISRQVTLPDLIEEIAEGPPRIEIIQDEIEEETKDDGGCKFI